MFSPSHSQNVWIIHFNYDACRYIQLNAQSRDFETSPDQMVSLLRSLVNSGRDLWVICGAQDSRRNTDGSIMAS